MGQQPNPDPGAEQRTKAVSSDAGARPDWLRTLWLTMGAAIFAPCLVTTFVFLLAGSSPVSSLTLVLVNLATTGAVGIFALWRLRPLLHPLHRAARALRRYASTGQIVRLLDPGAMKNPATVAPILADTDQLLRRMDRALRQQAVFCPVTALPNRILLLRDLNQLCKAGQPFRLVVFGMRNAEDVFSGFLPEQANVVMLAYVARLESELEGVQIYRIDQINFAFMVHGMLLSQEWNSRLGAILNTLPNRLVLGERTGSPAYMMGASNFPANGANGETLLKNALLAQIQAAAGNGGNQYSIFGASSINTAPAKVFDSEMTEKGLRRALEKSEFILHFQPVVDIRLEEVVSVEALIRWNDPERGMVPPGQFIGVAEDSGLIDQITMWVLYAACKQLRAWGNTDLAPVKISINLSARMLLSHDIVSEIAHALQVNRIDPARLEIELTETGAMHDKEATFRVLSELRALGVRVALDDFGTGYSGTAYLKAMPFDLLKIDREFVKDIDTSPKSRALCKTMIDLAKSLGIEVLAEGVERAEEAAQLVSMGCFVFQGFYFARPGDQDILAGTLHDEAFRTRIRQFNGLADAVNPVLVQSNG